MKSTIRSFDGQAVRCGQAQHNRSESSPRHIIIIIIIINGCDWIKHFNRTAYNMKPSKVKFNQLLNVFFSAGVTLPLESYDFLRFSQDWPGNLVASWHGQMTRGIHCDSSDNVVDEVHRLWLRQTTPEQHQDQQHWPSMHPLLHTAVVTYHHHSVLPQLHLASHHNLRCYINKSHAIHLTKKQHLLKTANTVVCNFSN